MCACSVFERALVVISESFMSTVPPSYDKDQFLEDSFGDLKLTISHQEECPNYTLEGSWESVVKAQDVLLSALKKWAFTESGEETSCQTSSFPENYEEREEVGNIEEAAVNDMHNEQETEVIMKTGRDGEEKLPGNTLQVQCTKPSKVIEADHQHLLETGKKEHLDDSVGNNIVENQGSNVVENQGLEGSYSSVVSMDTSPSPLNSTEVLNVPYSQDTSIENEVHMDIQLEHNYNHLRIVEANETASENGEPTIENEIYMDIKLSKPDNKIFTDPDLPVTLVVAKEDEPGVEVLQLSMSKTDGLLKRMSGSRNLPNASQDLQKLRSKKYEEETPFKYFCSQCSFKTKRHSHMRNHSRLHEKVCTIYSCDQCDYSTIRASHLQRHIGTHQTEVFACSDCTYTTHAEKLLTKHQRYKHLLKKCGEPKIKDTYSCSHCDYTTMSEKNFQRHMSVHSKQKRRAKLPCFKCSLCTYQTPSRSNYYRHLGGVHGDERPYMCTACGLRFKRSDTLAQHQATHDEQDSQVGLYTCPQCHKNYRSGKALKDHQLTHQEERRFLCEICAASFKTRAVQRKHYVQVHVDVKNNPCSSCSKSFASKYLLKRHMKVHALPKSRMENSLEQTGDSQEVQETADLNSWCTSHATGQAAPEDIQVIVVHQESPQSELSVQEGPLFQVTSSMVPGQPISVPIIPVEYVISEANSSNGRNLGNVVSTNHCPETEGNIIALTFVQDD